MKKYLLAFAAIMLGIVLNSFDSKQADTSKYPTPLYWFQVDSGLGDESELADADVSYLNSFSENPPSGDCTGDPIYNCVVGFLPGDVSTSPSVHLTSGDHGIDGFGEKRELE